MLNKASLAVFGALMVLPHAAFAAGDAANLCIDASVPKAAITARNGRWIQLTPEQWQFMRGIYAVSPNTPPGLPYGDKAVLAQVEGNAGGLVFFIDGDKACTPMPIPPELLTLMSEVATATVNHEGSGT
jgi:hypothetical protein